ncbi:hypothetical protein QT986_22885, partial [Microcoleus sp. herbarium14]
IARFNSRGSGLDWINSVNSSNIQRLCRDSDYYLINHLGLLYIAHRLFESVEQLENLLHKLLNEGELVIKWERKIKNKGNAVCAV